MGKSPGKWIKTVLFGKKSSKSNLSKGGANAEKKTTTEAAPGDFDVSPPVISDVTFQSTNREGGTGEAEKCSPGEAEPAKLGGDLLDNVGLYPTDDAERLKFEGAATKAQAAFRGYLARRAFRALKGIIRLQALIRGHLVRRQAVATLRCMQSVVKLQALARGRRVRLSNPDLQLPQNYRLQEILDSRHVNLVQVNKVSRSEKLVANAFARKLLVSLPTAMALSLQYDMDEPNAAWNWLERWSLLRFWEPLLVPLRKARDSKSLVKQAKPTGEIEPGKSRRTRKVSAVANGDHNSSSALEAEKPKRSSRKLVNHQAEVQPEQAQSELERVKRSLRKVTSSATPLPEKSEVEIEKPQQNARKFTTATISDALESETPKPSEQQTSDLVVTDKVDETEAPTEPLIMDEAGYVASIVEPPPVENNPEVEIKAPVEEDLGTKDEQTSKENQKTRRRKSLPTKQEYPENTSQNTSSLPSYMAATESAKAKLRAQAAAKLIEEGLENGNVRRHSLPPPPANGKPSSISPRLQKPAQANGKGGSKSHKTQLAPKDEKALPGWRR